MKTRTYSLLFAGILLGLVSVMIFSSGYKRGEVLTGTEDFHHGVVMNLSPIASANNVFSFGDICIISPLGRLTVVGVAEDRILAVYSVDGEQYGSPCPAGAIFFVKKDIFFGVHRYYRGPFPNVEEEQRLIKSLLEWQ